MVLYSYKVVENSSYYGIMLKRRLRFSYCSRGAVHYVLDADIKSFFNHIDHEWAVRFIESRIKDPNIIRLVRRMLKAGIIENYQYEEMEEDSEQGALCPERHNAPLKKSA